MANFSVIGSSGGSGTWRRSPRPLWCSCICLGLPWRLRSRFRPCWSWRWTVWCGTSIVCRLLRTIRDAEAISALRISLAIARTMPRSLQKKSTGWIKVSNLPLVKSFRVLCKYRTSPTSALDDAFVPVFWTVGALGLRRTFAQFEVLHDPQIVNDFLRLITEGIVRANFWRFLINAFWFQWFLIRCTYLPIPLGRSSSCSTSACGVPRIMLSILSSFFSSSATDFPALVQRWWESSRVTCQASFRIILGGGREDNETLSYRISSVLVFTALSILSAGTGS